MQSVVGTGETFWRTGRALGVGPSLAHTGSISEEDYTSNSYIQGIDFERSGEGYLASGTNLSAGNTILMMFKNCGSTAATVPRICHTIAVHEKIVAIADTQVQIWT